jgi:hypothetical protein
VVFHGRNAHYNSVYCVAWQGDHRSTKFVTGGLDHYVKVGGVGGVGGVVLASQASPSPL